jgi:predicted nucleic acid-binding protein
LNVLVDTSVWSLALRRKQQDLNTTESTVVRDLRELIQEGRARIVGIIRQELLSGIKTAQQFDSLQETLAEFPDEPTVPEDYVRAAKMGNACRAKGLATSAVDMLLCAIAARSGWEVLTIDPDFERYSKVVGIRLHQLRK